jgi:hypothetical protein
MEKSQLMKSWDRPNVQGRKWAAQDETAKTILLNNESLVFGDEIYVIENKKTYVIDYDGQPQVK